MGELLSDRVERLMADPESTTGEVHDAARNCAAIAASYLSGYSGMDSISAAREWAKLYRRCQEWLDSHGEEL